MKKKTKGEGTEAETPKNKDSKKPAGSQKEIKASLDELFKAKKKIGKKSTKQEGEKKEKKLKKVKGKKPTHSTTPNDADDDDPATKIMFDTDVDALKKKLREMKKSQKNPGFTGTDDKGIRFIDGLRVYTEEELKMNIPGSGMTKDCPFDCDCCF